MHQIYAEIQGANQIKIPYKKNITLDTDYLLESITEKINCICFANPNSPIGDNLSKDMIIKILKESKEF